MTESKYVGCMLGLALGDALGARHEGSAGDAELDAIQDPPSPTHREAKHEGPAEASGGNGRAEGSGGVSSFAVRSTAKADLRWTDDTQMAIGLAESLVECGRVDQDHLAKRWADRFEGWRGYGPNARAMMKLVRDGTPWRDANRKVFREGSLGNGAAMRAAPLGLFYGVDGAELQRAAVLASEITHAHALGIEGGVLIARAVARALKGPVVPAELLDGTNEAEFRRRLEIAQEWIGENPSLSQVRNKLGKSVEAAKSAVTAIHCYLSHPDDFLELIRYVVRLGGDTDTIGAMAGGIFGARNGVEALPAELLPRLEAVEHLRKLGLDLYQARTT